MSFIKTTGNFPTYRFYISTASSTTYEVFPLNFLASKLVDELESNNIFYRRKFTGSLIFGSNSKAIDVSGVTRNRKDDYLLFLGFELSEPCVKLYLTITKTVSGTTETYWEGFFAVNEGSFDLDRCIYEVTPLNEDDYTFLLEETEVEYDILICNAVTVTAIQGPDTVVYNRNRYIYNNAIAPSTANNVLEYLADKLLPGVTVSSTFFTDATNPVTLETNHLRLLTIAKKSDIAWPLADEAPVSMLSWDGLMEILWFMFQVKWDYDSLTNTINVEHISFWSKAAGLDLRTQLLCVATNKYKYEKEEMPKYEKFTMMEAQDANFVGVPIWYDSYCVNQDPKTNILENSINVSTDLNYIMKSPNNITDDGFVILCNYNNSGLYVELEGGALNLQTLLNMHLSWANLLNRYHRHNRVLIQGYLNGSLTTFWTAQKSMIQECSAIICGDYDADDYITTELGEVYLDSAKATVKKSELSPSGAIKFTLAYGPTDNVATKISDLKWMYIEEGAICGDFNLTLSQPADAGMDIIASHDVLDSLGLLVCSGGPETFTVTPGVRQYDFAVAICGGGVPAGGYVNFTWDFPTLTAWNQTIITNCGC